MSIKDSSFLHKYGKFALKSDFQYFMQTSSFKKNKKDQIVPQFDTNNLEIEGFPDKDCYNQFLNTIISNKKIIVELEEVSNLCGLGILTQHGAWGGGTFFTNRIWQKFYKRTS